MTTVTNRGFMEVWKDLLGHKEYMVSSLGRIMRKSTGKIYLGQVNNKGYVRFDLCEDGKRFVVHGHRAVAEAFIPRISGKPFINHKDGNKTNNRVDNLEWCTAKENSIHAFHVLGCEPINKKPVICVETGMEYESIMAAERETGIPNNCIARCCNGQRVSTHHTHWKYAVVV